MTQASYGVGPLVAVCTPVYNGGAFLAETIEAVQRQDYPNLVHVILDNASTDETAAVIAAHQARADLRHPIVAHKNETLLALSENWSRVLDLAPADAAYVRFLCADDKMSPDAVSRAVALAESDSAISVVGSIHEDSAGEWVGEGLPTDCEIFDGAAVARETLERRHGAISSTHFLARADVARAVSPVFRLPYIAFQDVEGSMRMLKGRKYGFIHAPLGWTRMHEASETSAGKKEERYLRDWLMLIERAGPAFLSEAELKACLRGHVRQFHRRLLLWRFDGHPHAVVEANLAFLRERGLAPKLGDYAVAMLEWMVLALTGRRDLAGAPQALSRIGVPPAFKLHPARV
ncbi:MAG: glycosyltransferase family 2 protein [Hyphomonadaceae bacterium]